MALVEQPRIGLLELGNGSIGGRHRHGTGRETEKTDVGAESGRTQRVHHHPPLPPISDRLSAASSPPPGTAAAVEAQGSEVATTADVSDLNHDPSAASPLLVSLRVCKHCQNALLGAFDHCLAKHGEQPTIQSVHEIDEIEDAKRLREPPYFGVIKDPTRAKNVVYKDVSDKVNRERWVAAEAKKAAAKEDPANLITPSFGGAFVRGLGVESGHVFSGALYKRMLDAKDREIQMLRDQLYERIVSEKQEQVNVEKLRQALNRSVNYYMYAEEWQVLESARLVQDVRNLKAELSSLMAFLINSEEDKRKLREQIAELNATIKGKEDKIAQSEQTIFEMKQKLHESFKEFLTMNETMSRLRKEAEKGSDTMQSRNELLQRNLEKLSRDYEISAKELVAAQTRTKELEFELEEIVLQFNQCGEAKQASEEHNAKLVGELDRATHELKQTRHAYEISQLQNRQLEEELREMNRIHTDTKYDLDVKITNLTKDLEVSRAEKRELDHSLKQYKGENEKLSNALRSLTRAKDQLESAARVAAQKHEKEITSREAKIQDLVNLRAEDAKVIKKLQEQKEQLMYQVTDLQNTYDRETANVNMLNFELAQVKRQSEEKVSLLEEQIEKLNAAKANLANDKRQLLEKFKFTRQELKQKGEDYDELAATNAKQKEEAAKIEAGLRKDLAQIREALATLQQQHATLQQQHAVVVESNATLQTSQTDLNTRQADLEARERRMQSDLTALKHQNDRLLAEHAQALQDRADTQTHLDSVLLKVDELTATISNLEREYASTVKDKDTQIAKLSKNLYESTEEVSRLDRLAKKLKRIVDKLSADLMATQAALESETAAREQLESALHDVRTSLDGERKTRVEFERMHARVDRRVEMREAEALAALKIRDRKLEEVRKGLVGEFERLRDVVGLLPRDEQGRVIEEDGGKAKDGGKVGRSRRGTEGAGSTVGLSRRVSELGGPHSRRLSEARAAPGPSFKVAVRPPSVVEEEE